MPKTFWPQAILSEPSCTLTAIPPQRKPGTFFLPFTETLSALSERYDQMSETEIDWDLLELRTQSISAE